MEIINQASGKFRDLQDEVCGFLFDILREINSLEREFTARDNQIKRKIPELSAERISGEYDLKWSEFRTRYGQIVTGRCTENLLEKGYGDCHHTPPWYSWADEKEDTVVYFQMDAPKKAIVEAHFRRGSTQQNKHRFKLIKSGEVRLIDVISRTSTYDNVWHRSHI